VPKLPSVSQVSRSLSPRDLAPVVGTLRRANRGVQQAYPGDHGRPQPVHTFYGGAHLFRADTAQRLGTLALAALDAYAPDAATVGAALGLGDLAAVIRDRVVAKLRREPVEDYRIDFEDGYGYRPDAEEDDHAVSAAEEVARGLAAGTLPRGIGLRIKPLSDELQARSMRTLDLFVTTVVRRARRLPPGFAVTIPKVMTPAQVTAVARVCRVLERKLRLEAGALRLEIMIETPQSILAPDGTVVLRALVAAGGGRVIGAHFGTYDYTALLGITAAWQHMRHPACDHARSVMQSALAQTGILLSDGGTNIMPVPIHRADGGRRPTADQQRANRDAVHRAWKRHFDDVSHSLMNGFYQGWDLHPAQLPTRYAAVYAFYLSARAAATERLRSFVAKAAQATLVGDVFDDAATGQGLLNFFVRGVQAGALTPEEAAETGLTAEEIAGRSFVKLLDARAKSEPRPASGRATAKGPTTRLRT
jgi:citrate lyase beta subunit